MMHRLREAMRTGLEPFGGAGKVVEAGETYFGNTEEARVSLLATVALQRQRRRSQQASHPALIERGGNVGSFHILPAAGQYAAQEIVKEYIAKESHLHTDESKLYKGMNDHFTHETVKHTANEYVHGNVTTNTIESYFSIFKRGTRGTYQHCAGKHLHRYLAEFDFRHNDRTALGVNDTMRAETSAAASD